MSGVETSDKLKKLAPLPLECLSMLRRSLKGNHWANDNDCICTMRRYFVMPVPSCSPWSSLTRAISLHRPCED